MDFIGPVLLAFMCDCFPEYAKRDAEISRLFKDIRRYIRDNEPYWVKEKATDVISLILLSSTMIKQGIKDVPKSPQNFVDEMLLMSKKRVNEPMKGKRPDKDGKFHFEINPPEFP
jgi:ssRNA-specific RNase YbeY (16S rRNA maturation enzyme)